MTTIGRVEFDVDFDGKPLPGEARKIGRQTAAALNKSINESFDRNLKELTENLRTKLATAGKDSGSAYSKQLDASIRRNRGAIAQTLNSIFSDRSVFDNFVISTGQVSDGLERIQQRLREARDQGILTGREFNRLNLISMNWGKALKTNESSLRENIEAMKAAEEQSLLYARGAELAAERDRQRASALGGLTGRFRQFRVTMAKVNKESETFFKRWKTLPSGFRRFAFFTTLFISLGSDIAGLGSAAGSGLTVLAGAFLAAGAAAGVGIAAFQGILGPLSELGPNAQIAQAGLKAIGSAFSELQDSIQEAVFANLGDDLFAIEGLVRALEPSFVILAGAVNTFFGQLAGALTSQQGFLDLKTIIEGAAPITEALGAAFIALGAAIGQILVVGQPFFLAFANGLNELFTRFNEFTRSLEGQNALTEWFENGQTIISAVLPLLGAAGTVLNNLVTPETVGLLVETLDNLTTFLAVGGAGILNFAALADPIGLIAQALADLSLAIAPAGPVLEQLARVVRDVLSSAISELAPLIGAIIVAFAPLALTLVEVAGVLLDALVPAITPLVNALVELAPALTPIITSLGDLLLPVIEALGPILSIVAGEIVRLLSAGLPILLTIFTALAPTITTLVNAIGPLLEAILPPLVDIILQLLAAVVPLIPLLLELLQPFLELIAPLVQLIGPLLPPLIELLLFLVTIAIKPLTQIMQSVLIPTFKFVAEVIENLFPIIDGLVQVLTGVLDFIVGVFTGDWDRAWSGIEDIFKGVWNSIVSFVESSVNNLISLINALLSSISDISGGAINLGQISRVNFDGVRLASGGLFDIPTRALIGEAGPEAVVPLNRPLNQVDQSVRVLSAIAQGKALPGNPGGGGRSLMVAEGAIQVIGVRDSGQAASAVLDRLVAQTGE